MLKIDYIMDHAIGVQIYNDLQEAGVTEFHYDVYLDNSLDLQAWCDLGDEGWVVE